MPTYVYEQQTPQGLVRIESPTAFASQEELDAQVQLTLRGGEPAQAPDPAAPAEPNEGWSPTLVRTGGDLVAGWLSAVPGPGTASGAAVGFGSEMLAQGLSRRNRAAANPEIANEPLNWQRGLASAATGAIPFGGPLKAGRLANAAYRGAQAAGVSAVTETLDTAATEGELPELEDLLPGMAVGGVLGGLGGSAEMKLKLARQAAETARAASTRLSPRIPIGPQVNPNSIRHIKEQTANPALTKLLSTDLTRDEATKLQVANALVRQYQREGVGDYRGVFSAVADGKITVPQLDAVLKKFNTDAVSFLQVAAINGSNNGLETTTIEKAGRQLGYLSATYRRLRGAAKNDPALAKALGPMLKGMEESNDNALLKLSKWTANRHRTAMLGRFVTAVRNSATNAGVYGLRAFDEAVQQTLPGGKTGTDTVWTHLWSLAQMSKTGQAQVVDNLLTSRHIGRHISRRALKERLFAAHTESDKLPSGFATIDRAAQALKVGEVENAITYAGRVSEMFWRRARFQAVVDDGIDQLVKARSVRHLTSRADAYANPDLIPDDLFKKATRAALEDTFSADPQQPMVREMLTGLKAFGVLGEAIQPYGRFWINAMRFIGDHNPVGAFRLLSKQTIKRQAALREMSEDAVTRQLASRAMTGSALIAGGMAFRMSGARGERWYEMQDGTDVRPWLGPFASSLFLGDMVARGIEEYQKQPDGFIGRTLNAYTPEDWAAATVAVNRTPTALNAFVDAARANTLGGARPAMEKFLGEYMAGFTVPLLDAKAAAVRLGATSQAARYDVTEPLDTPLGPTTLFNPAIQNIPGLGEYLKRPFAVDATTGEKRDGRDLGNVQQVRHELSSIGLDFSTLKPRTGNATINRELATRQGKTLNALMAKVMEAPKWQTMTNPQKRLVAQLVILPLARQYAREDLEATRPELRKTMKALGMLEQPIRDVLEEIGPYPDIKEALRQRVQGFQQGVR
jgi:hypothetical protein